MAIDVNLIKKKLDRIENGSNSSNSFSNFFVKLKFGETTIRIIDNKHSDTPGYPFIEKYMYYFTPKPMLCAFTFGKSDIISEFRKELYATKDPNDEELAKKLSPTKRVLLPVIVRDEQVEGVIPQAKWLEVSKTVYNEIMTFIADPEYGDIADELEGTDIIINKLTAEQAGNGFGNTKIRFARKSSVLAETEKERKAILDSLPDIKSTSLFDEIPEEKYREALEKYMDYKKSNNKPITKQKVKQQYNLNESDNIQPNIDQEKLEKFKNLLDEE